METISQVCCLAALVALTVASWAALAWSLSPLVEEGIAAMQKAYGI